VKQNGKWHQVGLLFFKYYDDARSNKHTMHKIMCDISAYPVTESDIPSEQADTLFVVGSFTSSIAVWLVSVTLRERWGRRAEMIQMVSCRSRHGSCTSGSCNLGMATVRPVLAPPTGQGHTETNNMGTTSTTHICYYLYHGTQMWIRTECHFYLVKLWHSPGTVRMGQGNSVSRWTILQIFLKVL